MSNVVPMRRHKDTQSIRLKISTSDGHPGQVTNVDWTWGDMVARLKRPTRDSLTLEQFKALPEPTQLRRKNNGYFVGGQFKNGIRKKALMRKRYLLTFDIDQGTPELMEQLRNGTSGLGNTEYVAYSTRKHSAAHPRVRLVMPLAIPIDNDKFEPLSRIMAQKLDPEMMVVDAVSFRQAQFMYWPSVCKGEDFAYIHNTGNVIDADAELTSYGDWQNYANLPRSAREGDLRRAEEKAPDPRLKTNLIGAYCRVHSVHDTIEQFLPETYIPSERGPDGTPTRYTYTGGTTANGAVVYDDGQYLYSHHGTDPCGGRLVNAFDLRRIHQFGQLDEKADEGELVSKLPSFAAMSAALESDIEVIADMMANNYSDTEGAWDDLEADGEGGSGDEPEGPTASPEAPDGPSQTEDAPDWRTELEVSGEGIIKPTFGNIVLILENAPHFAGRFAYDEFLNEPVVLRPIKSKSLRLNVPGRTELDPHGRVQDMHMTAARLLLEAPRGKGKQGWGLRVSERNLMDAHRIVSDRQRVHPVREYLEGLTWDNLPRVERLWIKACHTPDTTYFRQTALMWMTAAVARVFEPGCKFDFAPIIEGPQGLFKSTLLMTLGGPRWTGESEGHFDDAAKFVEATQGFWIVEIPELVQFGSKEVESIKACLSRRSDHVRLAYAHHAKTYFRQHIMAGTTNQANYFRDKTGNRRFWPIPCGPGQINLRWVERNRDQLWAEAVATYREMRAAQPRGELPLFLSDPAAAAYALELQGSRVVVDATESLAGRIGHWLDTPVPEAQAVCGAEPGDAGEALGDDAVPLVKREATCAQEIWERVLGGTMKDYDQRQAQRIAAAMKEVPGWASEANKRTCGRYGRQRVYARS